MSIKLKLVLFIFAILLALITSYLLKREKISVKYSLSWFLISFILMFVCGFPNIFVYIQKMIGFESMANMVIGIILSLLVFLTLVLTIIISGQKRDINLLIQEVSLLRKEIKK